jgi:signal transduction histidine kinase
MGEAEIAREIGEDLSRLERISHRFELIGMEPQLEEMDLHGVLGSLQTYLEARLPRFGSGVDLDLSVPRDLPPVMASEVLLTWALENVVKNSLDALGGEGGTIRIRAGEEGGKGIVISISDTGPGVSSEVRDDIFEPGVTTKERGWGVGLALSRRIVQGVHKGRIELGEEGQGGATFHIRLPLARSQSPGRGLSRKSEQTPTGAGP